MGNSKSDLLASSRTKKDGTRNDVAPPNRIKSLKMFAELGIGIVPLRDRGKEPIVPGGVHSAFKDGAEAKQYFKAHPDQNYAVATGNGFFVVDVDGEAGKENWRALRREYGVPKSTVTVKTAKGYHYYFCSPVGVRIPNSAGKLGKGIDIRGDGGYAVGPGSVHPTGFVYRCLSGRRIGEVEVASAPAPFIEAITAKSREGKPASVEPIPKRKLKRARAFAEAARQSEVQRVGKAPKHQRNHTLNLAAFKLGQLLAHNLLDEEVLVADLAKAAAEIGLDQSEIEPTIRSGLDAGRRSPRQLPFLKGHRRQEIADDAGPRQKLADELTKDLAKLGETDTDNAHRFATRFGHKVIYAPGHGWLTYVGKRWRPDALLQATEFAKLTARLIHGEAEYKDNDGDRATRAKFAQATLSKGALDRMLELAKGLLIVEDHKLDADPWLLNTQTGTIDLRTGRIEAHDARDLITKIAPIAADPKAKCPTFRKFLRRVADNDSTLMAFIRKAVGYSLTGDTSEQALFFAYGKSGANGKSTFVNCMREMLGDYGCHTATDTLLVKQYDNNIPVDLARLAGARMVTAIEANFNRHLDEAKIKGMTGGEPITARFMRQNLFEFVPQFKLWLVANDRPRVRGTDSAFWRRVKVMPFEVEIPKDEQDPDLPSKLRAEWPGILNWAIKGCLKWQREGLEEPEAVLQATGRWRETADHVRRFGGEALILGGDRVVSASTLYAHYSEWCNRNGEQPLNTKELKNKLVELFDMTHKRSRRGSDWVGVKLKD